MFRVDPVYVRQKGDPVDDGDLFTITCSRNELKVLAFELKDSEGLRAAEMYEHIREELS